MSKKRSTKTAEIIPVKPAAAQAQKPASADVFAALPNAIIVIDKHFRIAHANPAAESFLAGSLNALRDKELAHFLFPVTRLLSLTREVFEERKIVRESDMVLSGPRIAQKTVNIQIAPLLSDDERTCDFAIISLEVISAAGHIETQMQQRNLIRQSASMSAILAHEIKNPLSGIRGAAQLLEKFAAQEQHGLTQLICSEVDRITNLINEMEIFSNSDEIRRSEVNIHEALHYVINLSAQGVAQNVTIKENYDPSLPPVFGNRDMLVQLFLNLIKNAAEAIAAQPERIITLSTAYSGGVKYKPQGDKEFIALPIMVCVEDNGPGIPPDIRSRIFEAFTTSKEGGKGLGLAIVSKIVSDHHGMVELDESPHNTTRFKVYLPVAK